MMLTAAVRFPDAMGLKLILMLQPAPAASELSQVLVCAKSPAFVPVIAMLVMFSVVVPTLVRVEACARLVLPIATDPKLKLVGERSAVVRTRTATVLSL